MNSRAKGKRIELEAAAYLRELGFESARRAARNGVAGGEDLIVDELPNVNIEVKGDESIDLDTQALESACGQASRGWTTGAWAVLWRPKRKDWRLTAPDAVGLIATYTGENVIRNALIYLQQRSRIMQ